MIAEDILNRKLHAAPHWTLSKLYVTWLINTNQHATQQHQLRCDDEVELKARGLLLSTIMLDPFPFPAPPLLSLLSQKIANYTSLYTLTLHIHEYLGAALFYHTICLYISPYVSAKLFPHSYTQLSPRTKLNWNVHVVSLVQSVVINTLALWVIWVDEERWAMDFRERIWGYTGAGGLVQALAGGYFVWDLWVSTVHIDLFGWGPLAHAISALYVFSLGYVSLEIIGPAV